MLSSKLLFCISSLSWECHGKLSLPMKSSGRWTFRATKRAWKQNWWGSYSYVCNLWERHQEAFCSFQMNAISTRGRRGPVFFTGSQENAIFTWGERGFALFFSWIGIGQRQRKATSAWWRPYWRARERFCFGWGRWRWFGFLKLKTQGCEGSRSHNHRSINFSSPTPQPKASSSHYALTLASSHIHQYVSTHISHFAIGSLSPHIGS